MQISRRIGNGNWEILVKIWLKCCMFFIVDYTDIVDTHQMPVPGHTALPTWTMMMTFSWPLYPRHPGKMIFTVTLGYVELSRLHFLKALLHFLQYLRCCLYVLSSFHTSTTLRIMGNGSLSHSSNLNTFGSHFILVEINNKNYTTGKQSNDNK